MRVAWIGMIVDGAMISTGCSSVMAPRLMRAEAESLVSGRRIGSGQATTYQKGPVYGTRTADVYSLANPSVQRQPPLSPVGLARPPVMLGPTDSPLLEVGILGFGVKGLSGVDVRRVSFSGYAENWAELGLGRSVGEIERDPSAIYAYLQIRVFSRKGSSRLLMH